MPLENSFNRVGNNLPPLMNPGDRETLDRESMLYSYQNTVTSSYVGDIRLYVLSFGNYLSTKNAYWDPVKNISISFPIRYAAPNLAFSDDKGSNDAASEASIKDRLVLPLISYYLTGLEYDAKRAIDPSVRYNVMPDSTNPYSRAMATTAPKPMTYSFNVDIWTETRESFYQILTAFQLDFNPYSYLTDLFNFVDETQKTRYIPYAKMDLISFADSSNYVPGTNRRIVRGTLKINVEGWLTQPPTNKPYVLRVTSTSTTADDGGINAISEIDNII